MNHRAEGTGRELKLARCHNVADTQVAHGQHMRREGLNGALIAHLGRLRHVDVNGENAAERDRTEVNIAVGRHPQAAPQARRVEPEDTVGRNHLVKNVQVAVQLHGEPGVVLLDIKQEPLKAQHVAHVGDVRQAQIIDTGRDPEIGDHERRQVCAVEH